MTLTKLSLDGNNLNIPGQGEESLASDISAGDGKIVNFFLQCMLPVRAWVPCTFITLPMFIYGFPPPPFRPFTVFMWFHPAFFCFNPMLVRYLCPL
jgi:hypothetical protein